MRGAIAGLAMIVLLALPPARELLESVMIRHMLVQIPLLAVAGGLIATSLPAQWKNRLAEWNEGGVSGMLMALVVSSWWMLPRALDATLSSPSMEMFKFIAQPLAVGAPIRQSRLHRGSWSGRSPDGCRGER